MRRKKNNEIFFFAGVIVVIAIIIVMIMVPNRKPEVVSDSNITAEPNVTLTSSAIDPNNPAMSTDQQNTVAPTPTQTQPKISLSDVIETADAWMPCIEHKAWIGKPAPDFTITDIDGKQHTLSNYRGKSVIINLWAPWFTPTHKELETLIQLRQAVSTEKLMILGISFDSDVTVKRFVNKQTSINFPIISVTTQSLPAPYSQGKPYPCSMFISPDGILKLSAKGSIPLDDFQSILLAE